MYHLLQWLFIGLLVFSRASPEKISFIFTNDKSNEIATKTLDFALNYFQTHPELNVEIEKDTRVLFDSSDPKVLLEDFCSKYDAALQGGETPIIIDTTRTGLTSETIKSVTASLKLPTVSTSFGETEDLRNWLAPLRNGQYNFLVQIRQPADLIPDIVKAIVHSEDIDNAGILFDDNFVMDHKYKSLLQNVPARHMIRSIMSSGEDTYDKIKNFAEHRIFNYFVFGSQKTILQTIEIADKNSIFDTQYSWHFFTQDAITVPTQVCSTNCSFLLFSPSMDSERDNRIQPLNMQEKPILLSLFYFDVYYKTLIALKQLKEKGEWPKEYFYKQCNDYKTEDSSKTMTVDLRKELQVEGQLWYGKLEIENNKARMIFKMDITSYQIKEGKEEKSIKESWFPGNNINDLQMNLTQHAAKTKYRIVTVLQKPFMMKQIKPDGTPDYIGYCKDLLEEIRAQMGYFDYEIYEAPDKQFGSLNPKNMSWNGMIGELIDKKADIALSSLSVMAERENVIDFTVPYYDLVGYTILMKKPSQPTSLFKFLTVLEKTVWLCILAAYFFTSFLMWVFDRWSPYSYQNNREKYKDDEEKREFTLKECLWFCMTSLTPQGGGEAPKNLSGRLVAATWWLFGFIIIASYTANLAAFLTVSRLDTPVESLEDLSKQYKILYAPIQDSDAMVYFERMSSIEHRFYEIWKDMSLNDSLTEIERAKLAVWDYPVSDKYTKIWQAMQEATFPKDLETAVQRVKDSNDTHGFAFIGDATDIRYLSLTNCDLQLVGDEFSRKPYALATQQGSPLKDLLNNAILQLLNKRKLEKLKETWWKETVVCDKTDEQTDGISIQNIGGVFIVIFVGIGMACLTLVFEYWWYKHRKNPNVIEVGPASQNNRTQGNEKTKSDLYGGFRNRNTGANQTRGGNARITNRW